VNLDLRHDHSVPDADLIVSAATDAHFSLRGEDGNDRIGATGMGSEFLGPIPQRGLEIRGGDGRDTIYSGPERDVVDGGAGADTAYGEEGKDSLSGGEGNDRLFGGAGDDALTPGFDESPSFDFLSGGDGRDSLRAIDYNADKLDCGAGPDNAWVDPFDLWSRSTCEKPHGPQFN
jgi:Ca2+-binding RTX toxin-like protein